MLIRTVCYTMFSKTICNITRRIAHGNARMLCVLRDTSKCNLQQWNSRVHSLYSQNSNLMTIKRFKHSKKKTSKHKQQEEKDEDEDEDEDEDTVEIDHPKTKSSKTIEVKVNSNRLDVVTKAGIGLSRAKAEEAFYNSNIRVNGKKVQKKSAKVFEGDEIDYIIERSITNPDFLVVNRAVVLSMSPVPEGLKLNILRDKSLLIEDYEDPWHGGQK